MQDLHRRVGVWLGGLSSVACQAIITVDDYSFPTTGAGGAAGQGATGQASGTAGASAGSSGSSSLDSPVNGGVTPVDSRDAGLVVGDAGAECAPGHDEPCGSCGGSLRCDGTCSVTTPDAFGEACGACNGTILCDGSCSANEPGDAGQACGGCGGHLVCDGACSVSTPSDLGQPCGSCGGSIDCSGGCSVVTPLDFGQPCGSCGGTVTCDGSCSVPTPIDLGAACGSCGGTVQCGGCSVPTPIDFGTPVLADLFDGVDCCFLGETRFYGPTGRDVSGCYPGFVYAGCSLELTGGDASLSIAAEDPASCTCIVNAMSNFEPSSYTVHLVQTRGCD